jgi:hypothetical protein
MKTIKVKRWKEIPENFTGIVEYPDGDKFWYKDGRRHRENGPAIEYTDGTKVWYKNGWWHREDGPAKELPDGTKRWYLENERYSQIVLKDQIILDEYEGKYGIMWYKLLGEDKIFEYPDIPGLIEK